MNGRAKNLRNVTYSGLEFGNFLCYFLADFDVIFVSSILPKTSPLNQMRIRQLTANNFFQNQLMIELSYQNFKV